MTGGSPNTFITREEYERLRRPEPFVSKPKAFRDDVDHLEEAGLEPELYYFCDDCEPSFREEDAKFTLPLTIGCDSPGILARDLVLEMSFYKDGIARVLIGEPGNTRFRISRQELPVVWSQLENGQVTKTRDDPDRVQFTVQDAETYTFDIYFDPLRIEQRVDGTLT